MPNRKAPVPVGDKALRNWQTVNDAVRKAGLAECERLLALEKAGRARPMFLKRVHSRLNKVRRAAERADLPKTKKAKK